MVKIREIESKQDFEDAIDAHYMMKYKLEKHTYNEFIFKKTKTSKLILHLAIILSCWVIGFIILKEVLYFGYLNDFYNIHGYYGYLEISLFILFIILIIVNWKAISEAYNGEKVIIKLKSLENEKNIEKYNKMELAPEIEKPKKKMNVIEKIENLKKENIFNSRNFGMIGAILSALIGMLFIFVGLIGAFIPKFPFFIFIILSIVSLIPIIHINICKDKISVRRYVAYGLISLFGGIIILGFLPSIFFFVAAILLSKENNKINNVNCSLECSKCGKINKNEAIFCGNCGTLLEKPK